MKQQKIKKTILVNGQEICIKEKHKSYYFFKRLFDLFSSFFAILLLSPFILIVFIVQIIVTKGHPIFPDSRIGYKGKNIKVLKFRSMYFDAEINIDHYLTPEQKEIWLRERKLDNDPRITKFGKFLRKTSIDELPQLFNIFIGSMSVVGPRPMSEREVNDNFTDEQKEILLLAKPGLTGYWQVFGRSDADFISGERQKLEMEYFYHRGFWYDIGLIFKTIPTVIKHKGAK